MPGHGSCSAMLSAACSSRGLERRYDYDPSMWTAAAGCGPVWLSACLVAACVYDYVEVSFHMGRGQT